MKKLFLTTVMGVFGMSLSMAQKANADQNNIANYGYDVVNYFKTNTAARGSVDFSTIHSGAKYYFVSADNLKSFKENPSAYLPQFGGYCAFAMANKNAKVPVNPQTFRIDDGKLFLFYNDFFEGKVANTIIPWLANEAEMEKAAYKNWSAQQHNK